MLRRHRRLSNQKDMFLLVHHETRLHFSNMPTYDQIKNFGQKLAELLGYEQVMEKADSLVLLLASQQKNRKLK